MGSNSCFSKIIADVFPHWHCVNTHLNAPDQQTGKTSAFIEVLTLTDDQLIKCIWLAAPGCCFLLIPMGAVRVDFGIFVE